LTKKRRLEGAVFSLRGFSFCGYLILNPAWHNSGKLIFSGPAMRSLLRVFIAFWIAAAALVVVALALAALKTAALVASTSLYATLAPIVPGGGAAAWLIWGLVLGIVVLPIFASCIVVVLGIARLSKGWPFQARRRFD
jgi:hypothetical protein